MYVNFISIKIKEQIRNRPALTAQNPVSHRIGWCGHSHPPKENSVLSEEGPLHQESLHFYTQYLIFNQKYTGMPEKGEKGTKAKRGKKMT